MPQSGVPANGHGRLAQHFNWRSGQAPAACDGEIGRMKTRQGIERLSKEDKAKLIASVQRPAAPRPRVTASKSSGDISFKSLPGYEQFRVIRATSDLLGIANPFYRQHDVR